MDRGRSKQHAKPLQSFVLVSFQLTHSSSRSSMSIPGIVAHRAPTQHNYPAISLWGGVKAQLDSVSLVMFATRPRPMVWYYALPTGHLCIYLLACDVNLIDATEGLKRSARMVSPSVCRSFGISMECSGFALANPVQIMICMCRPVTFPINQTFTPITNTLKHMFANISIP